MKVFLPRIRFKRATRRGPVWVTEALFPNYLFARFDLAMSLRPVQFSFGVQEVVHFGARWPAIPETLIAELKATLGTEELFVVGDAFQPGDAVSITGGALHGLQAVVTRAMPARQRVMVLLEFLGRQTMVEVPAAQLVLTQNQRILAVESDRCTPAAA
jgi:transcriptional antiterminator RfaH